MKPLNLIFFGSPDSAATILDSLITSPIANIKVVAAVTNPDKPVGRKRELTPSPVAQVASNHHLPVFKPTNLDTENLAHLNLLDPHIFLVVAYGRIIPLSWIDTPSIATLNIHFSLLPKYRGALCVSEPIRKADKQTGITLMEIDEQLDHGPIISQTELAINSTHNVETLTTDLTKQAIKLLETKLPEYISGKLKPKPQNHTKATYTPATSTRTRDNAFIPWETLKDARGGTNASRIHALICSLNPDPGAWTKTGSLELKLIKASLKKLSSGLWALNPEIVQLPGKQPTPFKQLAAGHSSLLDTDH